MFRQSRFYLSFSFLVIFLFAITSCKSSFLSGGQPPPGASLGPPAAAPPVIQSPILADGSRTSYADIVDRVAPAVVKVSIEHKVKANEQQTLPFTNDFFKGLPQTPQGNQKPQIERGLGSGVIVSPDGTILTNHHVIEGADKIKIEMNDKRTYEAKVIGSDQPSDLAVLKIDVQNLPYLNLGNSDQVRVGDIVLAIGNPLGIGQTVTAGIISAKGRRTGLSDGSFEDFLQTDAPINRGNSGGALINLNGELVGINSQILSTPGSGGSIGIGFSIPTNMAKPVMDQILKDGRVRRGQLGVIIQNITDDLAKTFELKDTRGVIVSEVRRGSAADKAGVKRGDVITAINGEKTEDSNVLRNKVAGTLPGNEITLTILRDGKEQEIKATLDEFTVENAGNNKSGGNNDPGKPNESGKLGLDLQPITPELARRLELPADAKGLVVTDIDPTGPAAEAGIDKGDVILEINREPVETFDQAKSALDKAGDRASLLLIARGGRTIFVTVKPD
jgi:Do/DeqQ family serine protease